MLLDKEPEDNNSNNNNHAEHALTFEQQFELVKMKASLNNLSKEQLIEVALSFAKSTLEAQNMSKSLLMDNISKGFQDFN